MLKRIAVALVLTGVTFGQVRYTVEMHLGELTRVNCGEIPKGFACAILFDVDPPLPNGIDIANVVGGESTSVRTAPPPVIRSVSLILDGTLYTATYDPPLKRANRFSNLRRNAGIPLRMDGDNLVIRWPDGNEAKAKIVRREKIYPNQPQPV